MPWDLTGNANIVATNFLGTRDSKPLVIKTNGQERLHIDEGGNVGIGTTGPLTTRLEIASDAISTDILRLRNTNAANPRSFRIGPGVGRVDIFGIYDDDAAEVRLAIGYSGNVGIGTTSPGDKLEVRADSVTAVAGHSNAGSGVLGISEGSTGVYGQSNLAGFNIIDVGITPGGIGVQGVNNLDYSTGVSGIANGTLGIGVSGTSQFGSGVSGSSQTGTGVSGSSQTGTGVTGTSSGYGVRGYGGDIGVYAQNNTTQGNIVYLATKGLAGDFHGEVFFNNKITKKGGGFQIDDPIEPAKKYLSHSFVESPDMKNIYDGVVVLDANGEAEVKLPVWFEALNADFRYQLTCIGGYAPLYIAQEVQCNCFKIAGGTPGMKISWQVTGIRQDAWANAHRIQVEIEKPVEEQGYYLDPELHGESEEKSVRWVRYPKQEQAAKTTEDAGR